MRKILGLILVLNLAWSFNSADTNKTVDELSYKSKVLLSIMDSFLRQSEPKLKELEQNLTKSLADINASFSGFGSELGLLGMTLLNVANSQMSANFSGSNNITTLNTLDSFSPKKDDLKAIINLAPNLINFAEVSKNGDTFEVDIYTNEPVSKDSFNDLALKTANIIRQTHNSKGKVRVYLFNDFVKFSGLY